MRSHMKKTKRMKKQRPRCAHYNVRIGKNNTYYNIMKVKVEINNKSTISGEDFKYV